MTRILFERTDNPESGVAGLDLDLNSIPAEEEQEMLKLISDSNFFNLSDNRYNGRQTDKPYYTITVEGGRARHTIRTTEDTAPPTLHPLLDALKRIQKRAKEVPI